MNATSVLTELFNKGVHVSTQDDELVVDAPKGALEESDVKLIREHRDDIVELLRQIQLHRETPEPARRVGQSGHAPLSAVQQNVLLMESLAPGTPYGHIPLAFTIEGQVNHDALARALADVVAAHEILRTTYVEEGGRMVQSINAPAAFAVEIEDLATHQDPQSALESTLARHESRLFDLAKDRPLRALLVKLGEGRHVLSLVLHQIAMDGHSCQLFLRYLSASYARAVAGVNSAAAFMGFQYADFADWQARNARTPAHAQSLEYWRTALRGAPPLHSVPGDFVRPSTQRFAGRTHEISLSADDYARVEAFACDHACSVFTVLQAVFALLVSRYGGEDDVVLGTAVANRTRREFFGTLGNLVNTIPLRFDLAGRRDFVSLIEHARASIDAAMSHQHVPFNAIVDEARPARSMAHNPLVQLMLVIQEEEQTRLELEGCRIEALFRDPGIAKFDLTLHVYKQSGGAALRFEYATTLFRERTIARFARHFVELLRRCIAEPECELATLPLSTKEDVAEQPVDAGRYPTPVCVHELIARQVRATPERIAVRDIHGDLTYAALEAAAEKVAARLRAQRPSGGGLRVAVCTERCSFLVIAMYATLKAGGVYVPLDSEYPDARLEFMLADSGATLVLAQGVTPPSTHLPVLDLPSLLAQAAAEPAAQVSSAVLEVDAPAYVIYTSGSTGRPKGVLVSHRSLFYSLHANRDIMGFARTDSMPCLGSQAFGVSLLEILIPLVSGASVRMLPRDTVRDLDALIAATQDATVLHAVPSLMGRWLERVRERRENDYPKLRLLLVGGEAVPDELLRAIARWRADVEVIELYGMTETAVVCASYRPDGSFTAHHCIGRPHPTTRFRVLSAALQEQPLGVPGELHIGGLSLATEYLNQPELTAERFIADPFTPGARLYKTGDRVRRLHDGQFEFLGRVDHQVSLRGVRIELGEIEALLATHPAVKKAVAHVVTLANGEPTLVAWYTTFTEPQDRVGLGESLREHLARELPDYMRPALYQHLDALPLNPNGKVDRRQLPAPVVVVRAAQPATPTERAVAALWAELLALPEVDAESNFFDIGGNSLLATQLVNQARKHFSVDLAVTALFESPTVRVLARVIDDRRELVDLAGMVYDSRDAALAEREIVL